MDKKIYLVVAMSNNGVIGKGNRLPWHFSADLKEFKKLTYGHTVIMGRHTFESLGSKPLPGRKNFVLSRSYRGPLEENVRFFTSLEEAIQAGGGEKIFIIGGAEVYRQAFKLDGVDGIYLTKIDRFYEGDVYFPEIPPFFKEKKEARIILQEDHPKIERVFLENTRRAIGAYR